MSISDTMAGGAAFIIERWGGPAYLFREDDGVARECIAAKLEHNPRARSLALEGAERFLLAAPLEIEPDHELDKLVVGSKMYQIVNPVKGPQPADVPIYFDLDVVYDRTFDITPYI